MRPSVAEPDANVALRPDASGFVRRACPCCARHFKVSSLGEGALLLSAFNETLALANNGEIKPSGRRRCPYCGHFDRAEAFLTASQREWLSLVAHEIDVEAQVVRLRMLDPFSLASIQGVPYEPLDGRCPAEPDDMLQVPMWCCGERLKLKVGWAEAWFCPRCGEQQHVC